MDVGSNVEVPRGSSGWHICGAVSKVGSRSVAGGKGIIVRALGRQMTNATMITCAKKSCFYWNPN